MSMFGMKHGIPFCDKVFSIFLTLLVVPLTELAKIKMSDGRHKKDCAADHPDYYAEPALFFIVVAHCIPIR